MATNSVSVKKIKSESCQLVINCQEKIFLAYLAGKKRHEWVFPFRSKTPGIFSSRIMKNLQKKESVGIKLKCNLINIDFDKSRYFTKGKSVIDEL